MSDAVKNIDAIFDALESGEKGSNDVTFDYIITTLNSRGFGPLLCFLSLFMMLPTGAIPGMPIIMGFLISAISLQMLVGRHAPWMPDFITHKTIQKSTLRNALEKARPYVRSLMRLSHRRMEVFVNGYGIGIIAVLVTFLAVSMIPFGVIPFLVMLPAGIIFLFGLSLTTKDGLIAATAIIFTLIATLAGIGTILVER